MGCFFCCFRIKDDHRPQTIRVSQPITAIPKEPVDSLAGNNLWSALVSEEDSDHLHSKDERCAVTGGSPGSDDSLRAEAKFLKACGTLLETPPEIRKTKKLADSRPHTGDKEVTFHSWLPNLEKAPEKQPDQLHSPIKLFEEKENGSDSSEGCGVGNMQVKNKSVHFDPQNDACSSSISSRGSSQKITNQNLRPFGSPWNQSISMPSPYPTPLKLTDDMQTPATVFSSYSYNNETGKNPKIRSLFVYSGINPENLSQLRALIEEDITSEECLEQADKEMHQSQVKLQESTSQKELDLSSWAPPKSSHEVCNDQCLVSVSQDLPDFGQTPGVRPVNGIPNTTTKYKEDQKVCWHATPFEQRLEKALSEDESIPKMKQHETLGIEF